MNTAELFGVSPLSLQPGRLKYHMPVAKTALAFTSYMLPPIVLFGHQCLHPAILLLAACPSIFIACNITKVLGRAECKHQHVRVSKDKKVLMFRTGKVCNISADIQFESLTKLRVSSSLVIFLSTCRQVLSESEKCLTREWTTAVRYLAEATDFASSLCVQTSTETHPASYPMGTGSKARPGRDDNQSRSSSAKANE
jgi:hypothetical protein